MIKYIFLMLAFVGCGNPEPADVVGQISILVPAPIVYKPVVPIPEKVSACYDVVDWTSDKVRRCVDDDAGTNLKNELLEKWDCDNINSVRDIEALYSECKSGILLLTCNSFLFGTLPEDCYSQLVFDKRDGE